MQGTFVDTNVFLRHLLDDVPVQSVAAHRLIVAIEEGTVLAWTSAQVVAEIIFVLENPRTYNVARDFLRDQLMPLISLPNLKIERKQIYSRVFALYVSLPIDYVDAYHAALLESHGQDSLYSFDLDFDRIPGITRREP